MQWDNLQSNGQWNCNKAVEELISQWSKTKRSMTIEELSTPMPMTLNHVN